MKRFPQALVIAVAVVTWPALAADKPPDACTLLTADDIQAAVGVKPNTAAHPTEVVIPSGPAKGATMRGCMWGLGGVHHVVGDAGHLLRPLGGRPYRVEALDACHRGAILTAPGGGDGLRMRREEVVR